MDNRAQRPGGMGSPAQGVVRASCRACRNVAPGTPALDGLGVQPRRWSEFPAGPAGLDNRAHRPGGTGSPAQGVVGASCRACGNVEPGTPAWGDGESSPGGVRSFLQGLRGWTTGRTGPGGMGSPAQGVVRVSCRASGDVEPGTPAWGDGKSCPGGGWGVLPGLWGRRTGHTGLGGWPVQPRGWSEFSAGRPGMDNRAQRPGGDGESCPGARRNVLQGPWGRRTGHTGLGGWGVQPRGWSEFPAGTAGMDNRAHRPRGTGSPAQGVVGASCRACGEVDSGTLAWGDGESCPGVGRSVLLGLWGVTFGYTGLGGQGVLLRGWSERPAGPVGA